MIESSYSLYKLIVLFLLHQVNFPLSNGQISELFMEKNYTTYFRVQEVLSDMVASDLLETETDFNTTLYHATEQGEQTLSFFETEISPEIRQEIKEYLKDKSYDLRSNALASADFHKVPGGEYEVHCSVKEGTTTLLSLNLSVPTEAIAESMCENWRMRNQEAYEALWEILIK